jgi:hypothetical protein
MWNSTTHQFLRLTQYNEEFQQPLFPRHICGWSASLDFANKKSICPVCKEPILTPCFDGKICFLRCENCDGAYFIDEFDIELFIKAKLGAAASRVYARWLIYSMGGASTSLSRRLCPICRDKLRRHEFGMEPLCWVLIERCPLHGFWMDKKEIEAVLKGCQEAARRES